MASWSFPSSFPDSFSPNFTFGSVSNMFTCNTTNITWHYTGQGLLFNLAITNASAPLPPTTPTPASPTWAWWPGPPARRQSTAAAPASPRTIAAGLDVIAQNWTWAAVTVPAGQYRLVAELGGAGEAASGAFTVRNGTDVACLTSPAPPTPTLSATGAQQTSSPAPSTASPSPTSAHAHSHAVLLGVVSGVAVLVVVVATVAGGLYLRRHRPSRNAISSNIYTHRVG
ncbi:hypothetical protein BC834DRAFT_394961 [Gloeopeniophorella convolvens]|nr:hypothetical protein BC834DRAFT_394961 [Gloeopeniophorella convolvens]